ncbi:hypothetical protein [Albidovulum sp.]|jgi:hypothetical protein|uniref:hypothetical protein n=1 Tax=Albidovulum sp. TaxID=1872424 RepID=UPI003023155A
MASAQGALPLILLMTVLFCLPPAASLSACLRRGLALRRKGGSSGWLAAGAAVSAGVIVVNLAVIGATLWAMAGDGAVLGAGHALAALLSWCCFWLWIAVQIFGRRRRRGAY